MPFEPVGPDVLPEAPGAQPDLESLIRVTGLRSWMNGRLWTNDLDCLVLGGRANH